MPLGIEIIEGSLIEAEGVSLEFKSAQNPFGNLQDGEKVELL